jgi:hypothetical protein
VDGEALEEAAEVDRQCRNGRRRSRRRRALSALRPERGSARRQYRRVLCPNCGEENKERFPIYTAPEFPAARVDACDTCKTYIKSIDLTKDGHAIPVVDEIATVALNIWAEEHGYTKL